MTEGRSYAAGERLRVTADAKGVLHVHHGAHEIATIKWIFGGKGVRVTAGDRQWRLTEDDDGWTAAGDPAASLRHRLLRPSTLTVGAYCFSVRGRTVKNLLRLTKDDNPAKPALRGEILAPPPPDADAHALIVLATAAVALKADLSAPVVIPGGINGDNRSAALTYGLGHP